MGICKKENLEGERERVNKSKYGKEQKINRAPCIQSIAKEKLPNIYIHFILKSELNSVISSKKFSTRALIMIYDIRILA